jgi:hypothetical protein
MNLVQHDAGLFVCRVSRHDMVVNLRPETGPSVRAFPSAAATACNTGTAPILRRISLQPNQGDEPIRSRSRPDNLTRI